MVTTGGRSNGDGQAHCRRCEDCQRIKHPLRIGALPADAAIFGPGSWTMLCLSSAFDFQFPASSYQPPATSEPLTTSR